MAKLCVVLCSVLLTVLFYICCPFSFLSLDDIIAGSQEKAFATDSTPTSVKGEEGDALYSTETGAAKPIAEPVKQENSMPTPPPTTNGHIGPQDAATAIVSPTSQGVSHITEETSGVEIAVVETVQTQPSDQQPVESTSESMKEEPETQRPSAPEAFAEITPTAATPSTLPQAQSPTATKKQVCMVDTRV